MECWKGVNYQNVAKDSAASSFVPGRLIWKYCHRVGKKIKCIESDEEMYVVASRTLYQAWVDLQSLAQAHEIS